MSRGPTRTIGALAAYLEACQETIGRADDTACLILYRSELAQVTAALRCWQAERARSRATCFAKALWCEEGGDLQVGINHQGQPIGTNGRALEPHDRGPEGTGPLIRYVSRDEAKAAGFILPDVAAPTPPIAPEDQWEDWPGETMTEAGLLAGLEGLVGPLETVRGRMPMGGCVGCDVEGAGGPKLVCSWCSSITNSGCPRWRRCAPPSSAPASAPLSCSPRFGLGAGNLDTPSTVGPDGPKGT